MSEFMLMLVHVRKVEYFAIVNSNLPSFDYDQLRRVGFKPKTQNHSDCK